MKRSFEQVALGLRETLVIRDVDSFGKPCLPYLSRPGIETGPMTIHQQSPEYLIVKVGGHKYWAAIGEQGYAPARFEVWKIHSQAAHDVGTRLVASRIVEFPVVRGAEQS